MVRTKNGASPQTARPSTRGVEVVRAERGLLGVLAAWAGLSLVGGGPLWMLGRRHTAQGRATLGTLLCGIGRQAVLWGAVDLAIALYGASRSKPAPSDDAAARRRAGRMALITGVNAVADVGYVAGGIVSGRTPARRGDGVGVVVQGLFLLVLDVQHTRRFRAIGRSEASTETPGAL